MNYITIKKLLKNNKPYVLAVATILCYILIKKFLFSTNVFLHIEFLYAKVTTIVLNIISGGFIINETKRAIIFGSSEAYFQNMLALKYHLLTFLILFIAPKKWLNTIGILVISTVTLFTLTVFRIALQSYFEGSTVSLFVEIIISLRYLIIYSLVLFQFKTHEKTRLLLKNWNSTLTNTFTFSLNTLMIILVFTRAISGLFDWFLVAKWNLLVSSLTGILLALSNTLLSVIGYPEAYVFDKFILLKNYWLYLDSNCLGVGLMVVFSLLIIGIKSPALNKITFIIFGVLSILLMNAIRLVTILLYIYKNQLPANLIKDYHDISNNIFYIIVFIVIIIYVFWYQYLNLYKIFKITNSNKN